MADNPFFHRGPIRDAAYFCGRQQETQQISGLLRTSQSVSVVGPRRIGKTSLLYHLAAPAVRAANRMLAPQYVMASIDAQGAGQSSTNEVLAMFVDALRDALSQCQLDTRTADRAHSTEYHSLDVTLKWLSQRGTAVAFLVDEFELLAANHNLDPTFFSGLRGLASRYSVSYLAASHRPLISLVYADGSVLSSPFFNIFVTVPLGMLDDQGARNLLDTLLSKAQVRWPEPVLQSVLDLAGPHPFFLQMAAYHAFELMQSTARWNEQATMQLKELFYAEAQPHYQYAWRNLTDEEQHALANLAISQSDPTALEALRQLQQQCLILRSGSGYRYVSSSLQRFVRTQSVEHLLQAGPFVIDFRQRIVTDEHEIIPLTRTQFDLLACLALHQGHVVTAQELERSVWRDQYVEDPERLKAAIKHLRRALGARGDWVVNERGVGYALRAKGA